MTEDEDDDLRGIADLTEGSLRRKYNGYRKKKLHDSNDCEARRGQGSVGRVKRSELNHMLELAWCAGFFDGEGHTGFQHPQGKPWRGSIQMVIGQQHDEPLIRFREAVGVGNLVYPKHEFKAPPFEHLRRPIRLNICTEPKVRATLEILRPYLGSVKITQAEYCLTRWEEAKHEQSLHRP